MGTVCCKRCTMPNPTEYRFCGSCGRELPRQIHKVTSSWPAAATLQIKNPARPKGLLRLIS